MQGDKQIPSINLTMPPIGLRGESERDKLGAAVGFALVAAGLVLNEWVIAKVASPDGHIEVTSVRAIIWIVDALLVLVGAFITKHPHYGRGVLVCVLPILSLAVCSFVLFAVLEVFPSFIAYMKLDYAHYYALRSRFVSDDELVFRNRPFLRFEAREFKGDLYRDWYGVDVKPMSFRAVFDEYGFRNGPMPPTGWDVVVLGDSYIQFGHDEDDTFPRRLEGLSRMKTMNLGTGGHGPFQYLTVLKRYGLTSKAKYVLFCFFEGNDIKDISQYLRWKNNGEGYGIYNLTGKNFMRRYIMAFTEIVFAPVVRILEGDSQSSPGNLVTIKIGDSTIKAVFSYKNETRIPGELLELNEWKILKELLGEFKAIAAENNIVPIVLFLPTKAHIYAEYSTSESEANWLTIRDQQIAAKDNVETALLALCREVGIELLSLSPAFERTASQGKFLYYPFDTHWNSEGRQVAASVVAERLGSRNATN